MMLVTGQGIRTGSIGDPMEDANLVDLRACYIEYRLVKQAFVQVRRAS